MGKKWHHGLTPCRKWCSVSKLGDKVRFSWSTCAFVCVCVQPNSLCMKARSAALVNPFSSMEANQKVKNGAMNLGLAISKCWRRPGVFFTMIQPFSSFARRLRTSWHYHTRQLNVWAKQNSDYLFFHTPFFLAKHWDVYSIKLCCGCATKESSEWINILFENSLLTKISPWSLVHSFHKSEMEYSETVQKK